MVHPLSYSSMVELCSWCDRSSDRSFMVHPLSYSSVVRAFAHGVIGRRIDPS